MLGQVDLSNVFGPPKRRKMRSDDFMIFGADPHAALSQKCGNPSKSDIRLLKNPIFMLYFLSTVRSDPEEALLPSKAISTAPRSNIADEVPLANKLTSYDEAHFGLYMRLLDAVRSFAPDDEICDRLLGIDPSEEPERARKCLESHVKRALWLTNEGAHLIFPDKCPHQPQH